jgi:hypothetical protein
MDFTQIDKVTRFVEVFESSTLAEVAAIWAQERQILNQLAQIGLEVVLEKEQVERDPLLTPSQAASEIGYSQRHLRETLAPKYGIKSHGEGKGRRYRLSEINRLKTLMLEEG